jgi:hypothetical protein
MPALGDQRPEPALVHHRDRTSQTPRPEPATGGHGHAAPELAWHAGQVTGDERYEEAVRAVRRGLGDGDDLQTVLARLRDSGLGVIPCIRVMREVLGVSLGHAKALVHFSPAFADQRTANEALHDSLIDAIYQMGGSRTSRPGPR